MTSLFDLQSCIAAEERREHKVSVAAAAFEGADFVQVPLCSLGYQRRLRKVRVQGRFNLFGVSQ